MTVILKVLQKIFIGSVVIYVWLPLLALVVFSFNDSRFAVTWAGFTLNWYLELFEDTQTLRAFRVSAIVTLVNILISTTLGTLTAYGIFKFKFRGKETLRGLLILPLVMPYILVGISLLMFFSLINIPLGYLSMIIAHIVFSLPLITLVILARMQRIDWTLEEAAMDLGASRFTTWRRIIIPLLAPGILAAIALAIPWSFNDFIITYFVTGVGTTPLTVHIYSMIRLRGVSPVINALGTIVVLGSILIVVVGMFVQKIHQRRAEA